MARKQLGTAASRDADLITKADLVALLPAVLAALPTSAPANGGPWLNAGVLTLSSLPDIDMSSAQQSGTAYALGVM